MSKIVIAHLYPKEMNIYGDWGNIIALRKRLEWRGVGTEYHPVKVGEEYDFTEADIVFGGGGQDMGQQAVADDLQRHRANIHSACDQGVVMLTICGLYQLFGHAFVTKEDETLAGIGVFDTETVASKDRLIGNIVVSSRWGELVGFENHSGKTTLAVGQSALGNVLRGHGNNGQDGFEGAVTGNCFGTYLHGPLLPKNPAFCDELLHRALVRRHIDPDSLDTLDDSLEHETANRAKSRP